ncbi:MAG TPA: toll/interleukin-1 receptor domain-containing protein [Thermoanaerobaculia bacterium]|nr:toll/interleukin-1 receptor domain-containing protein [Thermoanaerobaculia bacterium]
MAEPSQEYDVFLSYSRDDGAMMRRLRGDLRAAGLRVWSDDVGLEPGTPAWEAEVQCALERSRSLVVVLSPAAKGSRWVGRELTYGDEHGVPIFPFLVAGEATKAVPIRLISSQWIDAREGYAVALRTLIEALASRLEAPLLVPAPAVAVPDEDRARLAAAPELEGELEACVEVLASGRPAAAWETYRDALAERLFHRAAFATCAALLEGFLAAEGGEEPLPPAERPVVTAELARSRCLLGDPAAAVAQLSAAEDPAPAARLVRGVNQMLLGRLAAAEEDLRAALAAGGAIAVEAEAQLELARLLDLEGRGAEAAGVLRGAEGKVARSGSDALEITALIHSAHRRWTTGASEPALAAAGAALDTADYLGSLPLLARACWLAASIHLSLASITRVRESHLRKAQDLLERARGICREASLPELEPDLHAAMARALRVAGRPRQAKTAAERGRALAAAAGYRLREADLEAFLAKVALEGGDRGAAERHARRAHELAFCDGPRGSYAQGLRRATALLARLGVEAPPEGPSPTPPGVG